MTRIEEIEARLDKQRSERLLIADYGPLQTMICQSHEDIRYLLDEVKMLKEAFRLALQRESILLRERNDD